MGEFIVLVLQRFAKRGLSINEGIAVDARLVKSASKPLSKEGLKELKEKSSTPEGNLDKNGNTLKFSRDVESDWSVSRGISDVAYLCTWELEGWPALHRDNL